MTNVILPNYTWYTFTNPYNKENIKLNQTNAFILAKKGSQWQVMSRDWHENFASCETIHTRWLCSGVFGRIRKNASWRE